MRDLEADDLLPFWIDKHIPQAWDTLERDIDVAEKKVRVTLLLDESVAKFYRALGTGYLARINRVLATFAQMRIAQVNVAEARIAKFRAEERERLRCERCHIDAPYPNCFNRARRRLGRSPDGDQALVATGFCILKLFDALL
jgi:hypothetical protein